MKKNIIPTVTKKQITGYFLNISKIIYDFHNISLFLQMIFEKLEFNKICGNKVGMTTKNLFFASYSNLHDFIGHDISYRNH